MKRLVEHAFLLKTTDYGHSM